MTEDALRIVVGSDDAGLQYKPPLREHRLAERRAHGGEATSDVGAQADRLRAVMACQVEDVEVVERRQQERFLRTGGQVAAAVAEVLQNVDGAEIGAAQFEQARAEHVAAVDPAEHLRLLECGAEVGNRRLGQSEPAREVAQPERARVLVDQQPEQRRPAVHVSDIRPEAREALADHGATVAADAAAVAAATEIVLLSLNTAATIEQAVFGPRAQVVSAAAGVVDRSDCLRALGDAFVVWLDLPPDVLARRFASGAHRPRYGPDPAVVLAEQRERRGEAFASVADLTIRDDMLGVPVLAERVEAGIRRHQARRARSSGLVQALPRPA